ncbi:MAG TPA: MFS transporter [Solirubrobacteraceae bacterium]|nr:MFS transporter [Solirubrobacteraceae bacterium]
MRTDQTIESPPVHTTLEATHREPTPSPRETQVRPWAVLGVLCIAVLVVNIDMTILNVALPTLVHKLHATSSGLQWIVDAYAIGFGGLLLVAGSLADRLGRKRLLLAGFCTFAAGSMGASVSGSVGVLIAWRAVMGAGAAMTIPAGLSILDNVFTDPHARARAIGVWGGTMGVGIALGPLAGGLLLSRFWWGSVFLVNVPLLVVGVVAAWRLVPESRNPAADRPDPAGALLSILGMVMLLWAIIEAPTRGWTSPAVVLAGTAAVVSLVAFVGWERRCDHPMLRLRFFRSRSFSAAIAALLLGLFALAGSLFVITQILQFDLGFSPLQAGVRILPMAALIAVAAPLSPLIARAAGTKATAAAGLGAIAAGLWWGADSSTVSATYPVVLRGMLLAGFGAGLLLPTAANSVLGSIPRAEAGIGSGTYGVAIQLGSALGVAAIGSALSTRYQNHITASVAAYRVPEPVLHTVTGSLGGALGVASAVGGLLGAALAHAARAAFMSGVHLSLGFGAVAAGLAVLMVLAALPSRPGPDD